MSIFFLGILTIIVLIVLECKWITGWATNRSISVWRALGIITLSITITALLAYFVGTVGLDTDTAAFFGLIIGIVSTAAVIGMFTRAKLSQVLAATVIFGVAASVTLFGLFYLQKYYVVEMFIIDGGAMNPTHVQDELVFVNRLSQSYERGDVIVYRHPPNPTKFFVHRIVGMPGDTLQIFDNRIIVTNRANPEGTTLYEPYAVGGNGRELTETLGVDEYFVLGDNRESSSDSRSWGVLSEDKIVGALFNNSFVWPIK